MKRNSAMEKNAISFKSSQVYQNDSFTFQVRCKGNPEPRCVTQGPN